MFIIHKKPIANVLNKYLMVHNHSTFIYLMYYFITQV
jgi:hypothetical protein